MQLINTRTHIHFSCFYFCLSINIEHLQSVHWYSLYWCYGCLKLPCSIHQPRGITQTSVSNTYCSLNVQAVSSFCSWVVQHLPQDTSISWGLNHRPCSGQVFLFMYCIIVFYFCLSAVIGCVVGCSDIFLHKAHVAEEAPEGIAKHGARERVDERVQSAVEVREADAHLK